MRSQRSGFDCEGAERCRRDACGPRGVDLVARWEERCMRDACGPGGVDLVASGRRCRRDACGPRRVDMIASVRKDAGGTHAVPEKCSLLVFYTSCLECSSPIFFIRLDSRKA